MLLVGPSPRGWGEPPPAPAGGPCPRTIPTRVGRTRTVCSHAMRLPDHPHAGGENLQPGMNAQTQAGPSPRGWGELRHAPRCLGRARTIPTRVGRTLSIRWHRRVAAGPSPRGWGERAQLLPRIRSGRTIPTRVGRTDTSDGRVANLSDHPHAGGENEIGLWGVTAKDGPSPRGWGEHSRLLNPPPDFPDHPHAGGENEVHRAGAHERAGPSPRGWGELRQRDHPGVLDRTIPTRVGRTPTGCPAAPGGTDHPHAGGENQSKVGAQRASLGPSPRGWGEHGPALRPETGERTIPTRVGRTAEPQRAAMMRSDHPHAGGENVVPR